nr:MAG: hypothetical protein [Molluscum contagiosum virus]
MNSRVGKIAKRLKKSSKRPRNAPVDTNSVFTRGRYCSGGPRYSENMNSSLRSSPSETG